MRTAPPGHRADGQDPAGPRPASPGSDPAGTKASLAVTRTPIRPLTWYNATSPNGPNRLWVTDLTMTPTGEGPLWLSAIRDAFSRRVVAWETPAREDADLALTSLEYALASREVAPGELVHHATTAVSTRP